MSAEATGPWESVLSYIHTWIHETAQFLCGRVLTAGFEPASKCGHERSDLHVCVVWILRSEQAIAADISVEDLASGRSSSYCLLNAAWSSPPIMVAMLGAPRLGPP